MTGVALLNSSMPIEYGFIILCAEIKCEGLSHSTEEEPANQILRCLRYFPGCQQKTRRSRDSANILFLHSTERTTHYS
jgi:hypothetical protein